MRFESGGVQHPPESRWAQDRRRRLEAERGGDIIAASPHGRAGASTGVPVALDITAPRAAGAKCRGRPVRGTS